VKYEQRESRVENGHRDLRAKVDDGNVTVGIVRAVEDVLGSVK